MPIEPSEHVINDARDRVKRLVDDLSADAANLKDASARALSGDDRREGKALIADTIRAALRLHDALDQPK